ncbi:MAG: AraC family transcriptional regulator ligand-binding domain-containing protein [Pseudomonadota bacterium]
MDHPIARIFVDEALDCGRRAGIDTAGLLRDLQIADTQLSHLNSQDFGRIWLALSLAMEDELFGLGDRPMRPGSTTLMGHAVRDAPTLDVALKRMLRFLRVVLDEPYGEIGKDGGACVITLVDVGKFRTAFAYRTFFLVLHGFTCWLARERVPLIAVKFPCGEPAKLNDYGEFFGVPVQFEAPAAQLSFEWRYMARPVRRSEQDLKAFLRTAPESFLRGYRDTSTLHHRVVETCLSGPPQSWPDMGTAAKKLRMSRATLHRRLAQTGQSYGALKENRLRKKATDLLSSTSLPITQIATELGYAEESAFYRAFLRWFGTTPAAYRRAKPRTRDAL